MSSDSSSHPPETRSAPQTSVQKTSCVLILFTKDRATTLHDTELLKLWQFPLVTCFLIFEYGIP